MNHSKRDTLYQIFNRLCIHSSIDIHPQDQARHTFIARLLPYPEDLICAAYAHLQRYSIAGHIPDADDFIYFIQPEYQRRTHAECAEGL